MVAVLADTGGHHHLSAETAFYDFGVNQADTVKIQAVVFEDRFKIFPFVPAVKRPCAGGMKPAHPLVGDFLMCQRVEVVR